MRYFVGMAAPGRPLTTTTIGAMVELCRQRAYSPRIRRRVLELLAGAPTVGPCFCRAISPARCTSCRAWREQVERIWQWVSDNVRFQADPVGVEHVTDPAVLDQQIDAGIAAEDCDSIALYAATLLCGAGIKTAFETQAPRDPDDARHVALVLREPNGAELPFDPVGRVARASFGLGERLAGRRYLEHFDARTGERMYKQRVLGGLFADGGVLGEIDEQSVLSLLDKIAGGARKFGPYGDIVAGVIETGEGIYGAVKPKAEPAPRVKKPLPKRRVPTSLDGGALKQLAISKQTDEANATTTKTALKWAGGVGLGLVAAKLLGVL